MNHRLSLDGQPYDGLWVQAIMYFPHDKYMRESWFWTQYVYGTLTELEEQDKLDEKLNLDRHIVVNLVESPSVFELKEATKQAIKKGVVAGDILATIYVMHIFELPEPSIKKAIHVAQEFAKNHTFGDSSPMWKSRKKIRDAFNDYRSVAHFWAALRLNNAYQFSSNSEMLYENLVLFLEVSAGLLAFGKNFIPFRARPQVPILPSDGMWELPENINPRKLVKGQSPERLRDLLSTYDANEYQY